MEFKINSKTIIGEIVSAGKIFHILKILKQSFRNSKRKKIKGNALLSNLGFILEI